MAAQSISMVAGDHMTERNNLDALLSTLVADDESRSETARLNDYLPQIEAALKAGVSRTSILKLLKDEGGFKMKENSFFSALFRLRKRQKKDELQPAITTTPKPAIQTVAEPEPSVKPVVMAVEEIDVEGTTEPKEMIDIEGMNKKEKREALGNKFIGSENKTNSILDRYKK